MSKEAKEEKFGPEYEFRYVLLIQHKKEKNLYIDGEESNDLKSIKNLAKEIVAKEKIAVMIWDKQWGCMLEKLEQK